MTINQWLNNNELSITIWNNKYRNNKESFDEWLNRVSNNDEDVKQLILDKKFLFGGRILSNRGIKDRKVTYSNCYVITPPDDNLESIFNTATKLARTFSYGGGCGVDISKLAPNGAKVHNSAKSTSGAVSFIDFFSYVTGLIGQNGRRGALMCSIDCTHPDLVDFINIKDDLTKCTKANISVRVSDEFMTSVINNSNWTMNFHRPESNETITKTLSAREIMQLLAKRNWEMGEPGILYWDRIQNYNLLEKFEDFSYAGVNPCAEEPLPAGGSCLLGSLNLSEFVVNPFLSAAYIDYENLEHAVDIAVRALNKVLMEGLNLHPLEEQRKSVSDWRQIGLGTFGLADMLIKLGVTYGSETSLNIIESVYLSIARAAVKSSLELAKENEAFPKCNPELIVQSQFIQSLGLSQSTLDEIKTYGLYNSQLLTCAPTGSIATMFQVSSGVEPQFALEYNRKTVSLNKEETTYKVYAQIVNDYKEITSNSKLTDCFVESKDITPINRIKVQSVLQKYTDASISSTINLPESSTIEDVFNIYIEAWKYGLKGVTVFRQGCKRDAILTTSTPKKIEQKHCFDCIKPVSRKQIGTTYGQTTCKKCACGTLYITSNKDNEGNFVELFTHTSKGGICQANLNAVTRGISLALRSGVNVDEIIDQLKGIHCPACSMAKAKGQSIDGLSCPDIIARTMKEFIDSENQNSTTTETKCPECGSSIRHEGGCVTCPNCGYSKCN